MSKSSRFERARCSRIICVQAMYQILARQQTQTILINDIINFRSKQKQDYEYPPDIKLISLILNNYYVHQEIISDFLNSTLQQGWTLNKMDRVVQAILMAAASELLLADAPAPAPIVISEYIDITKGFLESDDYLYINKSLDQFAHSLGKAMKKITQ